MKAVTLRRIPPDIAQRIEARARRSGASLNRTVIEMLAERSGAGHPVQHVDLDHLWGVWNNEEATAFDDALAAQRRIDEELWA